MEATLSRMKTIQIVLSCNSNINTSHEPGFRFVAASATFPNVQDVCIFIEIRIHFTSIVLFFLKFVPYLNNEIEFRKLPNLYSQNKSFVSLPVCVDSKGMMVLKDVPKDLLRRFF